jgi:hypothetical protein
LTRSSFGALSQTEFSVFFFDFFFFFFLETVIDTWFDGGGGGCIWVICDILVHVSSALGVQGERNSGDGKHRLKTGFGIGFVEGLYENPCFLQFGRQRTIFAGEGSFFWVGGEEFYRLKLTIFRLIVLVPSSLTTSRGPCQLAKVSKKRQFGKSTI